MGEPPTNFWSWELHNGLPTKGWAHFSGSNRWTSGGFFKYLKPRPFEEIFHIPLGEKGKHRLKYALSGGICELPGRYLLRLFEMIFFFFPRVYSLSGIFRGVPRTGLGRFAQFTWLQSPGCVEWDYWRHFFVDVKRSKIRDGSIEWHMYDISKYIYILYIYIQYIMFPPRLFNFSQALTQVTSWKLCEQERQWQLRWFPSTM